MYLVAEGGYVGACSEDADATESCQGVPRYDEQLGRQGQAAEPAHLDEDDQVDDADNAGERQEAEEAGDEEEVAAASAGGRWQLVQPLIGGAEDHHGDGDGGRLDGAGGDRREA